MKSFMGGIAPLDPGLRAEPLFTTHLWAKYGAQIKQTKNGTHGKHTMACRFK
jgi:hypothetical protein